MGANGRKLLAIVPSNTVEGRTYEVTQRGDGGAECSCRGFAFRGSCSHLTKLGSAIATTILGSKKPSGTGAAAVAP